MKKKELQQIKSTYFNYLALMHVIEERAFLTDNGKVIAVRSLPQEKNLRGED